ncbi:MAG: flagellar hook-associated protein FlgK [Planctomycetes bacterium RBG_13_50_24]|nr:MAG: flagellar hook-associated protein FlgK [Planctomycetes bacterium RBG_13_50_24]
MDSFSIGLSGLDAAQKALDTIGNNIANAATEGYHRQKIVLNPAYSSQIGSFLLGGGVDVAGITRMMNRFLEQEIMRQQSSLGQVAQEFSTLRTVEAAFGEISSDSSLNTAMDKFFNALADLSTDPTGLIWQSQAITAAQTMAYQFRTLGETLTTLEDEIRLEAENTIGQINVLINGIAELNHKIEGIEITGGHAHNLSDQRDRYIIELSELIGIQTQAMDYGVVNVTAAGIPVVTNASVTELEVGLISGGNIGVSVAGGGTFITEVQGGSLGGLLILRNEILSDIHNDLNNLAAAIIQQINRYHVQGVGSDGSFTELTGWSMPSENLADLGDAVTDGSIYIRLTNTSTGEITRHAIAVDRTTDSLTTIAADISAITGLDAWVSASQLHIQADSDYEFDFLPCVLPEPTAGTLTGASPPEISVSGIYTGAINDTFRFTVSGAGSVGNGTLQLEVRDAGGAGDVIATFNIGSGYAAGDLLDLGNGIKISLGVGDFGAGDNFDVDAFAGSDTSGVLAAIGINTFLSGNSALNIAVCSDISNTPGRIATCLGADMTDNRNVFRMAELKNESFGSLNSMTPGQFYRRLVTDIGQQINLKQIQNDNIRIMVNNLANQQAEISGVNINDEATQMLVFEQMYQAMAKYLNTIQTFISAILEII